jgi:hypothetical protein
MEKNSFIFNQIKIYQMVLINIIKIGNDKNKV